MSESLAPVNPDEIRGSYAKCDPSVPQQITTLLAEKNIPAKFLKRKPLLKELEDSFDALQDSFSYGKVITYSTNGRDNYYRRYEDEEEDEEENEASSEEEEYRPPKRTKITTGTIQLKYRRNGHPDPEGRVQDEEEEISFPSPIYSYEVGTNFLADFDDSFKAKESFRELKLTMNPSYQMLLDASEVSPFGHQAQTIIDPTVRKARHIPAERITDIEGFDLDEIVDNVRRKLFPQESKIEAKLLKLNIYQEGDFFVPHRDTPLSADSLGSLVIALPVAHRGGHLKVSHRAWKHTFAFDQDIASGIGSWECQYQGERSKFLEKGSYVKCLDMPMPWHFSGFGNLSDSDMEKVQSVQHIQDRYVVLCGKAAPAISYAAFYGDCMHEIEPVTVGLRLTLSYQLMRSSASTATATVATGHASAVAQSEDHAMVQVLKSEYDAELTKLTSLVTNEIAFGKTDVFLDHLTHIALKYLVLAKDKYGDSINDLKLAFITKLTNQRVPRLQSLILPAPAEINPSTVLERSGKLRDALIAALSNQSLADRYIGFPCHHLYESDDSVPKNDALNGTGRNITAKEPLRQRLKQLRGADALLSLTALHYGFQVDVLRIVTLEDTCCSEETIRFSDTTLPTAWTAHGMFDKQLDLTNYSDYDAQPYFKKILWTRNYYGNTDSVPRAKLMEVEMSSTGYFGNEASSGIIYAQCGIALRIPAWNSVARLKILQGLIADDAQHLTAKDVSGILAGTPLEKEIKAAEVALKAANKRG